VTKKGKSRRTLFEGGIPTTRITVKKWKKLTNEIERSHAKLRKKYPEIHGKKVDFVTHTARGTMVFFTIQFTDQTVFSLRYACDMFVVGADLDDVRTGDYELIREYMKPIPR
jgi:hypothetical protein